MSESAPIHARSLVLRDAVSMAAVHDLAAAQGWSPSFANRGGYTEKTVAEWDVVAEGEPRAAVGYREEHFSGFRAVTATSESESRAEQIAALLAANLSTVAEADVLERLLDEAEASPGAIVMGLREWAAFHYAVVLVGGVPGPFDPRFRQVLERHVAHPHRQVRRTAMLVADQLAIVWPECREPVIARKGIEVELDYMVDAFIEEAAK
jgi:hypothetical protein